MKSYPCPQCGGTTTVKDSRPSGIGIRRRRLCLACAHRFTTYECEAPPEDREMIRDRLRALVNSLGDRQWEKQSDDAISSARRQPRPMIWNQTDIATLRELAGLGLSNRQMAQRLGISPNAIAGAVFRFRLRRRPPPRNLSDPVSDLPYLPGRSECRWIADHGPWHPRLPQWCGRRAAPGSPYCPEHHNRCYTRRSVWRSAARAAEEAS